MGKRNDEYKPLRLGSKVMVHAYKLNGWLYRAWEHPTLIYKDEKMLVLDASKSWIFSGEEKSIRSFKTKASKVTYWYFFKDEWFNIIVTEEKSGLKFYINIASPFIYEQEAIKYYDFDLDFKIMNDYSWKELDINEFNVNSDKYNYNSKLIEIIKKAELKIKKLAETNYFHNLINKQTIKKIKLDFENVLSSKKEDKNEK